MSSVGGVSSSATNRSSIGGVGVGSTTDTRGASINQLRGRVIDTFKKSAVRFPPIISNIDNLKDQIKTIENKINSLIDLKDQAKNESLSDSERQNLNNLFIRGLREIKTIVDNSEENNIDISDSESFSKFMRVADIDITYSMQFPSVLRNGVIGSLTNNSSTSIYSQRIDSFENIENTSIVLDRAKQVLQNDYKKISNSLDSINKAYELSASVYNGALDLDVSGVSNSDQLARKLSSFVKGNSKDLLIRKESSIDRNFIDSILGS